MIKVIISGKEKKLRIKKNTTVKDLAKQLGITLNNYIVRKNDKIVPDTETLDAKDTIEFIKVISGG